MTLDDETLRGFMHAQRDAVVAVDAAGRVVHANAPAAALLGGGGVSVALQGASLTQLLRERGIERDSVKTVPMEVGPVAAVHVLPTPSATPSLLDSWPAARELPPRLAQTLNGLLEGLSEKEIARQLELSPHTVHDYVKTLYRRFQVQSRAELVALVLKAATTRPAR